MTTSFSRAAFLAAITSTVLLAATPAHAARNTEAEQYVATSATGALRALGDRGVSYSARQETFHRLVAQFADMPRIANYVLGRYGAQLRADAQLRNDWNTAFQEYSIAVYQDRLDRFSSSAIRVTSSIERVPGRDVIVVSEMTPRGESRATVVQWRLLRSGDVWKVVDVAIVDSGTEIWLAQQQQRDFLASLDRSNGNIRSLITEVQALTTRMRQRILARA